MTMRDRIVLAVIACLAIVGGVWLEVVSPERQKAVTAQAEVEKARSALVTAQQQAAAAHSTSARIAEVKHSERALKPAVPGTKAVPLIIDEISSASGARNVEFGAIQNSATSAVGSTTGSKTAVTTVEGMTPVPLTFQFSGNFFQLESLLRRFATFVHPTRRGLLVVDGRLIVINSLTLSAATEGATHSKKFKLQGQVTATAFTAPTSAAPTTGSPTTAPAAAGAASPAASPAVVAGGKP